MKQNIGVWLSLVERLVRDQEAVGSNPATPTRQGPEPIRASGLFLFLITASPAFSRRLFVQWDIGVRDGLCRLAASGMDNKRGSRPDSGRLLLRSPLRERGINRNEVCLRWKRMPSR